ncbi:MAG: hypothetical protein ACHQ17_09700, partial [Polyangia bacterium]
GIEAQYGTLPNNKFTDGGSPAISDGAQLAAGLDPTSAADNASKSTDTDGDNLVDVEETYWGLNPNARDSDGDGIQDDIELNGGRTNPLIADTDGDGIKDGDEDTNKNGVVDSGELDPTLWDSDGDGVSDGDERTETTDPLLATSRRLSAAVTLGNGTAYTTPSAVGSKGYLHLAWYQQNSTTKKDNTANDLYVALLGPDATAGAEPYKVLVAATQITAHTGFDDRPPAIVTLPGTGAIDRTLILNHAKNGEAFLTEIDFNQAARDGTASLSSTLVAHTRQITLPLAMQHVAMKAASDGSLQVVFLGSPPSSGNPNGQGLSHRKVNRGVYYLKLSAAGDVLVAPTELYVKSPPAHGHIFPRIDLDKSGDVHGIFRAGSCNWTMGTAGCSIYYFKISGAGQVLVPATRLQLDGNGGIDKAPQLAVAPNGNIDIVYASIAPRLVNNSGGNVVGRPILLHVISSVNNQITTLVNQKVLVDASPPPPVALDPSARLAVYHVPVVALDAGGNLHLFATEYGSNGSHNGYYWVFDPSGARKLGPFQIAGADSYGIPAVNVSQNRAFISYHAGSSLTTARSFDFSGLGLDESGNAQVPPPTVGKLTLTAVTPNVGPIGGKLLVTLVGSQFLSTTVPTIGGVTLTGVLLYDPAHLVATLDTTPLQPGAYDATVTNPNGDTATLAGAFYVGTPPDLATVNDGSMNPPAADMGTTKMSSGGCSCDVSGRDANLPLLSLFAFALLAFALRRRARR